MPDDLPRKAPGYNDDFYAWTQHQAAVLREMPVTDNRFDRENVAEEIDWMGSIASARAEMSDKLTRTIRREVEDELGRLYRQAKQRAELGFREHAEDGALERLPTVCPYTFDQLCEDDWYPDPVEKQP